MKLQELRKEKKMTQEELAKFLNLSTTGYCYYEQGKREPSIDILCKLADLYNVSLDYLVGRNRVDDIGYLTPEQISTIKLIKKLNHENLLMLTGRVLAMLESQGE